MPPVVILYPGPHNLQQFSLNTIFLQVFGWLGALLTTYSQNIERCRNCSVNAKKRPTVVSRVCLSRMRKVPFTTIRRRLWDRHPEYTVSLVWIERRRAMEKAVSGHMIRKKESNGKGSLGTILPRVVWKRGMKFDFPVSEWATLPCTCTRFGVSQIQKCLHPWGKSFVPRYPRRWQSVCINLFLCTLQSPQAMAAILEEVTCSKLLQ